MSKKGEPIKFGETIIMRGMQEVMHTSMLPYAEHVILERALPRVEDGLKPVQRRILFTMSELGITPDKPHRKSARIVGDCLGKYHPHGDSSVYDAMVRMAQNFNMQMPLVDGHGNFGSVDGDPAAAMRYTEARMTPLALELLRDIDKDTVSFSLNFDDSLKEPDTLPSRFPNLLVNGASGIAVGLATNIPPHNLKEAIDAVILLMDDPEVTLDELMKVVPCPDFPTGAYILQSDEIKTAYETGRGKITMRAKTHIEEQKNGKKYIVIEEFPYQVNKARSLEDILRITQEKKALFAGVCDIRDESDRMGTRAVIEVRKDADAEKILQYLFKYSDLQTTFGINMFAIAEGKPQQLSLKRMLEYYVAYQKDVITKRTRFDLEAARSREHILEGIMIAVLNIDEVIALIRASKTPKDAREGLMSKFELSQVQAQAILDLRLQRLTNLELQSIKKEYEEVKRVIKKLLAILDSPQKLCEVIKAELIEVRDRYALPRRTEIIDGEVKIVVDKDELRVVEDIVITIMRSGKIRRVPKRLYNGEPEAEADDRPLCVFDTSTDKRIKIYTNLGNCFTIEAEEFPETKPNARPVMLRSLIALEKEEEPVACMLETDEGNLYFYTRLGMVKCSSAAEYATRSKRIAAISLKDGDTLLGVSGQTGESIFLLSKNGMSIRFATDSVPTMGRVSAGVKCFKLDDDDEVMFYEQMGDEGEILTLSDRGYAKRSFAFDFDLQGRNGKGLKTFEFKKNGSNGSRIAAAFYVKEPFDMVIRQFHGTKTVMNTEDVKIDSRAGKGVLLVMAMLDDVVVEAYKKY